MTHPSKGTGASYQAVTRVNAEAGPESSKPRKPSLHPKGEGKMNRRKLDDTFDPFRRGDSDSMVTRTGRATGEALLAPERNFWSKVDSITVDSGK